VDISGNYFHKMKVIIENVERSVRKEVETDLSLPYLMEVIKRDIYWQEPSRPIKWLAIISNETIHIRMWSDKKDV